jgi:hypothetical protein
MSKIFLSLALATAMFVVTKPTDAAPKGSGSHGNKGSAKGNGAGSGAPKNNGTAKTAAGANKGAAKGTGAIANNKGNGKGQIGSGKGIRFDHGIYYRGRDHHHWGSVRFDRRYGCNCYWDPYVSVWYYWCQPDDCYYPVSYCPYRSYTCSTPVALSTVSTEPVLAPTRAIVNNNVNTNNVQVNVPAAIPANPVNEVAIIPEPASPRR